MATRKWIYSLWLVVLAALVAACAGLATTPTPAVAPQPAPDIDYRAALATLKTYRAHAVLEVFPAEATGLAPRRLEVTVEAVNSPHRARRTVIQGLKGMARPQDRYRTSDTLRFVEVGGALYMSTGTTWLKTPAQNDPEQGILNPSQLIPDPQLFTLEARGEAVNGVLADRYRFSDAAALAYLAEEERAAISRVDGKVWLAQEGNYVVRYRAEAEGQAFRFAFSPAPFPGRIAVAYDVTHINEPLRIEPPAEALGELPETEEQKPILLEGFGNTPFPVPDGTRVLMQSRLFAVLDVPLPATDAARFFADELAALGWTLQSTTEEDRSPVEHVWEKAGYTLHITVVADRNNPALSHVTVGVNPPEGGQ